MSRCEPPGLTFVYVGEVCAEAGYWFENGLSE